MQATLPLNERRPWSRRWFPNGEWILLFVLAAEIAIFSALGENFFTSENFFEVIRLSVELGLLALALTPVMVTGGIDLSVGSMMGLAAVAFGAAWHDWGWPVAAAAALALCVGLAGGGLNAALITRLRIPPIIVTLGAYSMFRGIAEGITHGAVNYSGFPGWFLALGQGYIGGIVPVQFPLLLAALAGTGCCFTVRPSGGRSTPSASAKRARATRASRWEAAWPSYTSSRAWSRARPPSSTWRTWGRPSQTPAPATSWRPSRRWFWAAPRSSAAGARSGARCSACFPSRCCKTACGWPRFRRS